MHWKLLIVFGKCCILAKKICERKTLRIHYTKWDGELPSKCIFLDGVYTYPYSVFTCKCTFHLVQYGSCSRSCLNAHLFHRFPYHLCHDMHKDRTMLMQVQPTCSHILLLSYSLQCSFVLSTNVHHCHTLTNMKKPALFVEWYHTWPQALMMMS